MQLNEIRVDRKKLKYLQKEEIWTLLDLHRLTAKPQRANLIKFRKK